MTESGSLRLNRLSAADVAALRKKAEQATSDQREAEDIVAKATAEAAHLKAKADAEWRAHQTRLSTLSEDVLRSAVDARQVTEAASAIVETMQTARRVQRDFDDLVPWLLDLVCDATFQIIGEMDPGDRWAALLTNAMSRTKARWDVVVVCHPDDRAMLQAALAGHPDLAEAVHSVQTDATSEPGCVVLRTPAGAMDVSLATQMGKLRQILEETCRTVAPPSQADIRE